MRKIIPYLMCLFIGLAFASCGSDDEPNDPTKNEAQQVAERLNGVWVCETYSSNSGLLYETQTFTFTAFDTETEVENISGVKMPFNGKLHVKDVYAAAESVDLQFDYFYSLDTKAAVIKAWSTQDGQHWSPTILV